MKVRNLTRKAKRFSALLLAFVMLLGSTTIILPEAKAASWMTPYLEQAQEWGVMRGDAAGNLNADRKITRGEFVTMMNRAFGYKEMGPNPFSDVPDSAWYADDIRIARKAGYFMGSTDTTAQPNALVTREQAATMLGRSLRFQNPPGVITKFHDNQRIGVWSRGYVQEAADQGIIQGYQDGNFRPRNYITRGQVACFLVRALGTLIQTPGEHSPSGIYGNLTINTPGVTLKNTTITGNLYLTGGVGAESVVLENVTVMGKIIVCGAGESQKGKASVILRNVQADEMVVDSIMGQFLTVRSEGLTDVKKTTVRTSSYIEDLTADGDGLHLIQMEGGDKMQVQLAGNIKEVWNRTPGSLLVLAQGTVQKVTVDEKAVNSELRVDNRVEVQEMNLDVGTKVTGTGDISHVNVSAPGSQVEILPDTITVRPGITADVDKENMDSVAAAESSEDPRILTGYPVARDVSPRGAEIFFRTNKKGTLYWAMTALADGSIDQDDLLSSQKNNPKILQQGTIDVQASRTEVSAKVSKLTADGSYYISAMLVDNRGRNSQVKVTAFSAPDDSVPNFATGYPQILMAEDKDGNLAIQARVMATKDCQLYYALMPKGSAALKPEDFKAAAISGNLGWGVMDVRKNTPHMINKVNNAILKEMTEYDLYFWLSDADNGKSSAVKKVTVKTPDRTPPKIQHLTLMDAQAKSIAMTFALDEPGTLYWAVVKKGAQFYQPDRDGNVPKPDELPGKEHKIQIMNGVGALKKGNSSASKALTDVKFNISGLESQTAYDLYFVAVDKAGNFSEYTMSFKPPMEIKTLDDEAPTVKQEFTHDGTDAGSSLISPYPDTSIRLVFSEPVQGLGDDAGTPVYRDFYKLYTEQKTEELAAALKEHVKLYRKPLSGQPVCPPPKETDDAVPADWLVDYRKATVGVDTTTGEMIITLPYHKDKTLSGLNLSSGTTYYFQLERIVDTSPASNPMRGERGVVKLPEFTTIDAQMIFSRGTANGTTTDGRDLTFDMFFKVTPVTADSVEDEVVWDLLFWSGNEMEIEVYSKDEGTEKWTQLKSGSTEKIKFSPTREAPVMGVSLTREFAADQKNPDFEQLNKVKKDREYGIIVKSLNGSTKPEEWSGTVSIDVMAVSGDRGSMTNLANTNLTPEEYDKIQQGNYKVRELGVPTRYPISCPFRDKTAPTFINGYPSFHPGDSGVNMDILLNRGKTKYFYVVTEVENIPTKLKNGAMIDRNNWDQLPTDGTPFDGQKEGNVSMPKASDITNPKYQGDYVIGSGSSDGSVKTISINNKLKAETKYIAYFVLQGESPESISEVFAFRFETEKVVRPVLEVQVARNTHALVSSKDGKSGKHRDSEVQYMVLLAGKTGDLYSKKMADYWDDTEAKKAGIKDTSQYKTLTLMEAMATPCYIGNLNVGSAFDLCANASAKDAMRTAIESASTDQSTVIETGKLSLTKSPADVDCKSIPAGKQKYWFVAMGRSPLGSGYAFAAGRYLTNPDNQYLKVTGLSTSIDRTQTPVVGTPDAFNKPYTGTVTISFDGALYWRETNVSTPMQVVDKKPPVDPTYVSSSSILQSTKCEVVHKAGAQNERVEQLTLKFTNITPGETIDFVPNLCSEDGMRKGQLSLELQLEQDPGTKLYIPKFVLSRSSSDWNGMGGK